MSPYLRDPRWSVDWVRLVGALQATGMSLQNVADAAHVSKSQVRAYGSADLRQRPEHSAGERLIALWCTVTGLGRDEVPMHRRALSVAEVLKAAR